jgi:uncharacterized NAD-dependent epimerase/dehydratase family protein
MKVKRAEYSYRGRYSYIPLSEPLGDFLDEESRTDLMIIAGMLGSNLETHNEWKYAIRKAIKAGVNVAAWFPDVSEDAALIVLESFKHYVRRKGFPADETLGASIVVVQSLFALYLVYDFFEDERAEKVRKLLGEFIKLNNELVEDPNRASSPDLLNRASALIDEAMSVVRGRRR